jgi:hypothetical protein
MKHTIAGAEAGLLPWEVVPHLKPLLRVALPGKGAPPPSAGEVSARCSGPYALRWRPSSSSPGPALCDFVSTLHNMSADNGRIV